MKAINPTETAAPHDISQPAFDAFCANLLKGLHAAAQPLTILRAGLSADCTGRMNLADLREMTDTAAGEIDRLCELFSNLKQLIQAERFPANCTEIALMPLLEKTLLELRQQIPNLQLSVPESLPPILAEPKDAAQVLTLALRTARAVSDNEGTLELDARPADNTVEIIVRNPSLNLHALTAEYSLAVALAEARMHSQGGSLHCALKPFSVTITFRIAHTENKEEGQ